MSVKEVVDDAYEKGLMDKGAHDKAIEKIVKGGILGKKNIIGEIEFIEDEGRPEIVLEEGEIAILPGSTVEVVKRQRGTSIIVKRGLKGKISGEGLMNLKNLVEDEREEGVTVGGKVKEIAEIDKSLGGLEHIDWTEGYEGGVLWARLGMRLNSPILEGSLKRILEGRRLLW